MSDRSVGTWIRRLSYMAAARPLQSNATSSRCGAATYGDARYTVIGGVVLPPLSQ